MSLNQQLDNLEKKRKVYEKMPDSKKIGPIYEEILKDIENCRGKLKEYTVSVDSVDIVDLQEEENSELDSNFDFDKTLEKIDTLHIMLDEGDISIEEQVELFKQLQKSVSVCKKYIERQKMEVKTIE